MVFSYNYFSVLANEFETIKYYMSIDKMVDKFLDTSNKIGKSIKTFIPSKLKGPTFHCSSYIKNLIKE
jgi:hypothetical protein